MYNEPYKSDPTLIEFDDNEKPYCPICFTRRGFLLKTVELDYFCMECGFRWKIKYAHRLETAVGTNPWVRSADDNRKIVKREIKNITMEENNNGS